MSIKFDVRHVDGGVAKGDMHVSEVFIHCRSYSAVSTHCPLCQDFLFVIPSCLPLFVSSGYGGARLFTGKGEVGYERGTGA